MRRLRPIAAMVCAAFAAAAVGGCSQVPPPGGARGSKPDRARKSAEELALNIVGGVAKAQARSLPELTRASGDSGRSGRIASSRASAEITIVSPRSVPPAKAEAPTPTAPAETGSLQFTSAHSQPQMIAVEEAAPTPKSLPRPGSPAIIKVRVASSMPFSNVAEAEEDALTNARSVIEERLAKLDPPVIYRPSLNEVKNEFARKDSLTTHPPSQAERDELAKHAVSSNKLLYAELDVEVTADQIRELRTRDRVSLALRAFSGLTFIALASFLFLRADEWTKGYLTRWLACGAVVLVGGAAAALYFV